MRHAIHFCWIGKILHLSIVVVDFEHVDQRQNGKEIDSSSVDHPMNVDYPAENVLKSLAADSNWYDNKHKKESRVNVEAKEFSDESHVYLLIISAANDFLK